MAKKNDARQQALRDKMRKKHEKEKQGIGGVLFQAPKGVSMFDITKAGKEANGMIIVDIEIVPFKVNNPNPNEPAEKGDEWHMASVYAHHNQGVDGKTTVVCLAKTHKEKCSVCDFLQKNRAELTDKEYYDQKPKKYDVFNVINLSEKDEPIQVFMEKSTKFYNKLQDEITGAEALGDDVGLDYPWLVGGKTLRCRFKSDVYNKTKYWMLDRVDFVDREDYDDAILEESVDLFSCIKHPKYDDVLAELYGESAESSEDSNDDTEETTSPRNRRKAKPADEDEVEEPTPDEEDVQDESPPRREKKTPKSEGKCPFGHRFGVDVNVKDECFECDNWDACEQASKEEAPPPEEPKEEKKTRTRKKADEPTPDDDTTEEPKRRRRTRS